ncbi:hypothetical protein CLU79DRAFT_686208, partial [Phycomyces nitens]
DPNNEKAYALQSVTTKDVFDIVQSYTSLFEQRTVQAFANWCSTHFINFLKAKSDR